MQDNSWVDFKIIKSAVSIEKVLARYAVNWLRKKDDELRGRCPIHQGEGTDTFHASISKNVFNCFSCKKRGNVLDFVAAMEKCSVRDAAVKIAEWFSVDGSSVKEGSEAKEKSVTRTVTAEQSTTINKPLTFSLKGIDHSHRYLTSRGISSETAEKFGVGHFPGRGSMAGRIVIPIHDEAGQLVAYAGRSIDNSEPKYKLPPGFHKSQVLYNLHRAVEGPEDCVVLVEGFFDCIRVSEFGKPCVALMGCSMSAAQESLLAKNFGLASILLDGDEAGRNAATEIAAQLCRQMHVRVLSLPEGKEPHTLTEPEFLAVLK